MVSKRNPRTAPAVATPEPVWNAASELPRQQLSAATESACAMFRGFEAMRRIQEQAAHDALEHYARATAQIREANDPNRLMEIQAELLRFDLDGSARYWQQLGAAAVDMQREMLGCCAHLIDNDALQRMSATVDGLAGLATNLNPFLAGAPREPTR